MTAGRPSRRLRARLALVFVVAGVGLAAAPGCRSAPGRADADPHAADGDGEAPNAERTDNVRKVFEHGQDS